MVDFTTIMSPERIALAHKASALMNEHIGGVKLKEAMLIGEAILDGRNAAMEMSGSNDPRGGRYTRALAEWKLQFGFADKPKALLDDCMIAAQHRALSDEIIASLKPVQRANFGVAGLAKRVRAKLKEIEGKIAIPRVSPQAKLKAQLEEAEGKLAHLEEERASIEEDALPVQVGWFKDGAVDQMREFADAIIRIHPLKAKTLCEMLAKALDDYDWEALGEGMVKRGLNKAERNDTRRRKAQEKRAAAAKADRERHAAM